MPNETHPPPAAEAASTPLPAAAPAGGTPAPLARLIVVDDEIAQMRALCDTLRDEGYATIGYGSAKMALAALKPGTFDLLLTDLMMPEMDGIALLGQALQIDPHLVGIMMTGQGTITSAVDAMKAGALDYILKPFKLSVILPVLNRALAVRNLRLENEELERRIRQRTEELAAANKELESFAYAVSHDLRSPLRGIDGWSQALLEDYGPKLDEQGRGYLETVRGETKRMGQLIDALLDLSRVTRQELRRTPVDMSVIAREIEAELRQREPERQVEMQIAPDLKVEGDQVLLRAVLQNLLGNAWKYSGRQPQARIEFGAQVMDGRRVFHIRDNGAGFDMTYASKLFTPFQRLHRMSEFPGTGVGLATVQRIMARHGGRIWAEGQPGVGAVFYFTW